MSLETVIPLNNSSFGAMTSSESIEGSHDTSNELVSEVLPSRSSLYLITLGLGLGGSGLLFIRSGILLTNLVSDYKEYLLISF